ncbi:SDR family NAD(P)-dependent oxidoreductase [Specibacter cremeus]|uniref:SDR family NAD(P)-dependent oxidoreductase n=1 Tax=Specibacter cremeus TaxID=1629051 RepID=UPI000F787D13|nr:glucose 1-dehydrogenase [Specibacter cremeus]
MTSSILDRFSLAGKVALVTGGAMGLGLAMATALTEAGATIVLADVNEERGAEAAASLAGASFVHMDVTDEEQVRAAVVGVVETHGHLDILLNNAGITIHAPLETSSTADWRKVMDVNLDGVYLVLREVGNVMVGQGSGSIINTASMSGIIANVPQAQASYNASKGAVIMLTKSAAAEWASRGVRVNAIAPGYMETELTKPFFAAGGAQIDTWMAMTPMGRPGQPDELGGAAVFLASEAASFITGAVLSIDGGYTAI